MEQIKAYEPAQKLPPRIIQDQIMLPITDLVLVLDEKESFCIARYDYSLKRWEMDSGKELKNVLCWSVLPQWTNDHI